MRLLALNALRQPIADHDYWIATKYWRQLVAITTFHFHDGRAAQ